MFALLIGWLRLANSGAMSGGVRKKNRDQRTDPGSSVRVASPRQGDFAKSDRGFKGEGPALARLSHHCDTPENNPFAIGFPLPMQFSPTK